MAAFYNLFQSVLKNLSCCVSSCLLCVQHKLVVLGGLNVNNCVYR